MLLSFPATLRYWAGWPSSSQGRDFFLSVSRKGGWDTVAMSEWDGQVCVVPAVAAEDLAQV